MIVYFGLALVAVFLTSLSHILMKMGSRQQNTSGQILSPYLNRYTISAYVIFLFVTLVSVIALQKIPLKLWTTVTSLNFAVVALMSWRFLKEEMDRGMVLGILIIVTGVVVFTL
jgi:uncharacterized membrane protein